MGYLIWKLGIYAKYFSICEAETRPYFEENTTQKMKFSSKGFFNKYDKIPSLLRIWSHLLKKSLMENFIFCVVEALYDSFCNIWKPLTIF